MLILFWYVGSERLTPTTNQARVEGYFIPLSAQVSGQLNNITVVNNQLVKKGDVLAEIAPERYELAIQIAEANLKLAGQEVGAGTASVSSAQSALIQSRSDYQSILADANRLFAVEDTGVIPQADIDRARAKVTQANARVQQAEAELSKAKQQLGVAGDENPKLQLALAQLGQARLDLRNTQIIAPSDGGITNVQIDVGHYASVGQALMTFISTRDVWLEASFRENNLGNMQAGDTVEIILDSAPGQLFKGELVSIGFGVSDGQTDVIGSLPTIANQAGWFRAAQRFPVVIRFDENQAHGLRRFGGQADVVVYTQKAALTKYLAKLSIRIKSWLNYVY
ncbi:HlyD family secretion protein [Alginatibacterium sediminis]|uniref:HlyD family secretion protein n=2 Tax=Alginatibacterium sediminis TaxID=2164068 RepID=A0A420EIB5_9ALTE|nr:HlyD family secretion protein [Alginatibacterium sediminis]